MPYRGRAESVTRDLRVVDSVVDLKSPISQQVGDGLQKLFWSYRLSKKFIGVFCSLSKIYHSGDEENGDRRLVDLHLGSHFGTSYAGKEVIGNYEVNFAGMENLEGISGIQRC